MSHPIDCDRCDLDGHCDEWWAEQRRNSPTWQISGLEAEVQKLRKQLRQRRARMKTAIAEARREALEEAAKDLDREAVLSLESSKRCDATGNTTGGALDAARAVVCREYAAKVRALAKVKP